MCRHISTALVTHKNGLKFEQAIITSIVYYALYLFQMLELLISYNLRGGKRSSALYYRSVQCHGQGWSILALLQYEQRGIN